MKIKTNHFNKDSILKVLISNNKTKTNNRHLKALTLSVLLSLQACNPAQDFTNYRVEVQNHLEQGNPQTAIILLKNVLRENPDDSAARFTLGNIYLAAGDLLLAQKEITRADKLSPNSPKTQVSLAKVFFNLAEFKKITPLLSNLEGWPSELIVGAYAIQSQVNIYYGDLEQAYKTLAKASQINKNHPDVLYSLALLEGQQLSFSKAKKHLEQLLTNNPNYFKGLLLQGNIALKNQNFDEAIRLFEKASQTFRTDNLAKIKLAEALVKGNKLDKAKKQLLTLLLASPSDGYINYLLATVEFTQKNYKKAVKFAENTINNAQRQPDILYIAAASNYMINNDEAAYRQVKQLLLIVPKNHESLKLKAILELRLGLNEQGTTTLAQIEDSALTAKDSQLLISAGLASLKTGDFELSKQFLTRADAFNENTLESKLALASLALKQGDIKLAINALDQAVKSAPKSLRASAALSMSYIKDRQAEQALKVAQQISLDYPQKPHGPMLEGLAYALKQEIKNTESAFMRALSIQPGHPKTTHLLAALVIRQNNDVTRARELYTTAIKHYPKDVNSLVQLYIIDREADKKEQSTHWLEQAIDVNPNTIKPWLLLSQYHLSNNNPTKSLKISEQGLTVHPENTGLLALIADAQRHSGQQKLSIESFQKLQRISPDMFFPHYRLAEVYEQTGQLELAQESITRALKLKPKHLGALVIKARVTLKNGDIEGTKTIVAALQKLPYNIAVTKLQAQIALREQRPADAVNLYQKILTTEKTNYNTIHLSSALWQQSERQKAIETLVSWLDLYPNDTLTMNVLGDYYLTDNQVKKALNLYRQLVELTPKNSLAHNNLAWLLLQKNSNLDTALQHAIQANQLSPNSSNILDTLGLALYSKGDYIAAKRAFSDAVSIQPSALNMQFHLAQSHVKVGETLQAGKILEGLLNQQVPFSSRIAAQELLDQLRAEL